MKKALIASTALVLTAGVAAADVTLSGYGRTGVRYIEDRAGNETQVDSRVRINIDASTSTDNGVDFGARIRLQWNQGQTETTANAGKLWVTASGFTVEVGNVDNAYDTSDLLFGPELGAFDTNRADRIGNYFAYASTAYSNGDRQGLGVKYSVDSLTVRASYIDPDQSGLNEIALGTKEELSFLVQYTWNDRLDLEGAYTMDGAGVDDNDIFFIGARYAVLENAHVGLNYVDASNDTIIETGNTFTLYGDYTLADGLTNIEGYVANNDLEGNETDNAFGIGVNYDLGGARLGASLQRDFDEKVYADMGVRFDF